MFFFKRFIIIFFILLVIFQIGITQNSKLPEGRTSAVFIYHPASKALLLFDGYQIFPDSNQNNVWKWDGNKWEPIIAFGPESRSLSAGALNTHTGIIQLFGGVGKGGYETGKLGDSWSFNGVGWKEIRTNNIGSRDHHEIVYADHLRAFVLYGGINGKRENDSATWLLKGDQFIPMNIPGPGTRYHFALAYDKHRKKVVLYGGGRASQRDELWEFDGSKWIKIYNKINPGKRLRSVLVYDEDNKRVVLHGGDPEGATWAWDGKEWKKIAEQGPVVDLPALGYDPLRKTIVLYGGSSSNILTSELWELKDEKWKKISDNGRWKWVDAKLQRE